VIAQRPHPDRGWLVTVVTAAAVGLGAVLTLGGVVLRALSGEVGRLSRAAWVATGSGALLLLAVAGLATLTVLGGAIALRRHGLETRGRPYARRQPREWKPGLAVRTIHRGIQSAGAILSGTPRQRALFPYDLVEVRSLEEILETLDARGTLDALPFMPEMATFCGRRFRVFRRAEKINDYVTGAGLCRMRDTVLLERLRCDGQYHGGCQACCHLLWKEAWLKRTSAGGRSLAEPDGPRLPRPSDPAFRESDLLRLVTRVEGCGDIRYVCQMTEIARASTSLFWNDPRHYLRDLFLGNVRPGSFVVGFSIETFNRVQRRLGNGVRYPHLDTTGLATSPHQVLDLQPGDVVRVRAKHEIERTLTAGYRNRGLLFAAEMLRFCGGEYRVSARVQTLVEEKSGKLITLTNPCVILDGVTASGEYFGFYAQNESIFWREIWLEKVASVLHS
jgi:hypothetical protein